MAHSSLKTGLRQRLQDGDFAGIAAEAGRRRRVLPALVSLTFDADQQIAWRAIEALGLAANRVADDDPEFVREQLRRLYWLISEESGGICWRAPEAMAEILRHRADLFSDWVPIVLFLIVYLEKEDLVHFRAGALWATGRLADAAGEHTSELLPAIQLALGDPDPQVRGTAVWCLLRLGKTACLADGPNLEGDPGAVVLYEERALVRTTVGQLARRARAEHSGHA
jgi:methylated-DNA-[protein]-cysteine S-methyltransferase